MSHPETGSSAARSKGDSERGGGILIQIKTDDGAYATVARSVGISLWEVLLRLRMQYGLKENVPKARFQEEEEV